MKNKDFFYLQYNKVSWKNQEKTKLNSFVNEFIIREIISKKKSSEISLFDIGFGIGFFFNQIVDNLKEKYSKISLEGCEPSLRNYQHFNQSKFSSKKIKIKTINKPFLEVKTKNKFDFITSIYVFPHIESDELESTIRKIKSMLNEGGKFILVVANEEYLRDKLNTKKDLFIEKNHIKFRNKTYNEVLHYTEIPEIGTIIDYNREDKFYLDLFKSEGFNLELKKNLSDNGFICNIFVFSENNLTQQ